MPFVYCMSQILQINACGILLWGWASLLLWFVKRLRCQWGSDPSRSLAAWPLSPLSLLPLVFTSEQWEGPLPSFLRSWETVKVCGAGFMCCRGDAVLFPSCLVHREALLSQSEGSTQWKRDKVSLPHPLWLDQSLLEMLRCLCIGKEAWHSVLCWDNAEPNTSPTTAW